jgi:hypothetical protein
MVIGLDAPRLAVGRLRVFPRSARPIATPRGSAVRSCRFSSGTPLGGHVDTLSVPSAHRASRAGRNQPPQARDDLWERSCNIGKGSRWEAQTGYWLQVRGRKNASCMAAGVCDATGQGRGRRRERRCDRRICKEGSKRLFERSATIRGGGVRGVSRGSSAGQGGAWRAKYVVYEGRIRVGIGRRPNTSAT